MSKIDKSKFVDSLGRFMTQGLFIDYNYDDTFAVYTLKDQDLEYNGVVYPSLKALYLKEEDLGEYTFATKHLGGWKHWQRICGNAALSKHIEEWREELEIKIRSQAIKDIINTSVGDKGFQAQRWLADRGWVKRGAGRPSKAEIEKQKRVDQRLEDEFSADIMRMADFRR